MHVLHVLTRDMCGVGGVGVCGHVRFVRKCVYERYVRMCVQYVLVYVLYVRIICGMCGMYEYAYAVWACVVWVCMCLFAFRCLYVSTYSCS